MQPGDIVESVDMEMSDDETDSKPKGRVLVDLRLQDRDMRVGAPPSSHHDMDMRIIPLPVGQMSGPHDSQLLQDMHLMHSGPPPPLPQFQHQGQGGFRQEQPEFSHCKQSDFHLNQPKFQQNRPPNFLRNQQDFHSNQQEFHQLHQSQQDFEYRDRDHNIRSKQDFLAESPGRGRYSTDHHQHDNPSFHRNEWNNRGGGSRGFPRNRRDRYSEDHNVQKQRNNLMNSRKSRSQDQQHHQSPSEILPNNRSILQPPETAVIFNEENVLISMPEFDQDNNVLSNKTNAQAEPESNSDNCQSSSVPHARRTSHDMPSSHDSECNQQQQSYQLGDHEQQASSSVEKEDQSSSTNQVTVIPIRADNVSELQQKQHIPISECEEHVEPTEHSDLVEKTSATDEPINQEQNVNSIEKEPLDESMSSTTLDKELKRTANGDCDEQSHEEGNPNKKRPLLQNGPPMLNDDLSGPNGPTPMTESHLSVMYEYDGPNFRPRIGAPFPLWRGGPPPPSSRGGRGGFRGGPVGLPRGPWLDRGPRGPIGGSFSPRGLKRGGKQFWGGGGFRGRGRGSNW